MSPRPNIALHSEALVAEVSPLGAELQRLATVAGEDLQWDGDPAFWTGRAPILFPIVGMLHDGRYRLDGRTYLMPKHGFARRSEFAVIEQAPSAVTFRLGPTEETRSAYPFDFQLDMAFTLDAATLTVAATVANLGDRPMPASFGFHPALRWPLPFGHPRDDHRIMFEREEPAPIRRIDPEGLLTPQPQQTPVQGRTLRLHDELFVEDALIFDRVASRRVLLGAETGPQLAVSFEDFPMLGVWTKPGAGFICIEPWAGLSDPEGFEGDIRQKPGVFEVAPGASRRLSMSIALLPASRA